MASCLTTLCCSQTILQLMPHREHGPGSLHLVPVAVVVRGHMQSSGIFPGRPAALAGKVVQTGLIGAYLTVLSLNWFDIITAFLAGKLSVKLTFCWMLFSLFWKAAGISCFGWILSVSLFSPCRRTQLFTTYWLTFWCWGCTFTTRQRTIAPVSVHFYCRMAYPTSCVSF